MPAVGPERTAQVEAPIHEIRSPVTLSPLRTLGRDALKTEGLPAISKIILITIEITFGNAFNEIGIRKADDIFGCAVAEGEKDEPIPKAGTLTRAIFEIHFIDSPKPRVAEIHPPHTLKLARGSDAEILKPWLASQGFALAPLPGEGNSLTPDAEQLEMF